MSCEENTIIMEAFYEAVCENNDLDMAAIMSAQLEDAAAYLGIGEGDA